MALIEDKKTVETLIDKLTAYNVAFIGVQFSGLLQDFENYNAPMSVQHTQQINTIIHNYHEQIAHDLQASSQESLSDEQAETLVYNYSRCEMERLLPKCEQLFALGLKEQAEKGIIDSDKFAINMRDMSLQNDDSVQNEIYAIGIQNGMDKQQIERTLPILKKKFAEHTLLNFNG